MSFVSRTKNRPIVQGEFLVSGDPDDVLTTLLGSCVAACMRDPVAMVGGLNHFLLPGTDGDDRNALKYGLHSMELLINALIHLGAHRGRLECKLFGGAQMMPGLKDIGRANAEFAEEFLRSERINYLGGSLGGNQGRRIRFRPFTGQVQQMLIDRADVQRELPVVAPPPKDDIILF